VNTRIEPDAVAPATLQGLFWAIAARTPDAPAVVDGDRRLTYAQLTCEVDRYARALIAKGVGRGDRVIMLAAPSLDFWIVFHACAAIGATWLGVNPRYQSRDFAHVLSDADPALVVVMSPFDGRDYCAELAPLAAGVPMVCHGEPTAGAETVEAFLAAGATVSDETFEQARLV
jgi:acyl-CoA synthetase (AMP-forming)/AMP-acid ligase II